MNYMSMKIVTKFGALALLAGVLAAPQDSVARNRTVEFEHADLIAVLNVVDEDVQIFVRAATEVGIKDLRVLGPRHTVRLSSRFRDGDVGQADVAFDTTEPSLEELMEACPPGDYRFFGRDVEGTRLFNVVPLSYEFADAAEIIFPAEGDTGVPTTGLIVMWTVPEEPAAIRIAVENEETGESVKIDLPGDAIEFTVPDGFLEAGTEYVVDVIAIAENGNLTVNDALFTTEGEAEE